MKSVCSAPLNFALYKSHHDTSKHILHQCELFVHISITVFYKTNKVLKTGRLYAFKVEKHVKNA